MIFVSIVSLIAVLLVQLETQKKISFGYGFAFFLVTFIQAIHYDYGYDYNVYFKEFYFFTYQSFSYQYLTQNIGYRDAFWPLFCFVFKPIGFLEWLLF